MLDIDHPMTQHIFRASSLIDVIMDFGQKISVASGKERTVLRENCQPYFQELRTLTITYFPENTRFILHWVAEYDASINLLSSLVEKSVPALRQDNDSTCSSCGKLIHLRNHSLPEVIVTPECCLVFCVDCAYKQHSALKQIQVAKRKLSSASGFLLDAI